MTRLWTHYLAATFFSTLSGICVVWFASLLGLRAQLAALTFPFVIGVLLITGCVWCSLRVLHTFKRAQDIKLGLRGEQAVAEALNEAAECGFRSFHDFPAAEVWNIDHVAGSCDINFLPCTKSARAFKHHAPKPLIAGGKCDKWILQRGRENDALQPFCPCKPPRKHGITIAGDFLAGFIPC
jgi:hypothetical protein